MTALSLMPEGMSGAAGGYPADCMRPAGSDSPLPLDAPTVTIVGSAWLGDLIGAGVGDRQPAAGGTGFRGAPTTFSTFGYDTRPVVDGARAAGTGVIAVVVVAPTWRWP